MKAKIVDIEDNSVTIKTEGGKFVTVPRKKLKFDCNLGQTIIVEKDDGKFYFLPESVSFWGDDDYDHDNQKPKTKVKITYIILVPLLIVCLICFIPVGLSIYKNHEEDVRSANLSSCLGGNEYKYDELIECYRQYGGADKEEKIAEQENMKEGVSLIQCLREASNNYALTDEEIEGAKSDLGASIVLIKRVGSGYRAQRECYVRYSKITNHDSEIDELDAKISENDAMVSYAESAQAAANSSRYNDIYSYSSSFSCSSRTVGSSTYTSCF